MRVIHAGQGYNWSVHLVNDRTSLAAAPAPHILHCANRKIRGQTRKSLILLAHSSPRYRVNPLKECASSVTLLNGITRLFREVRVRGSNACVLLWHLVYSSEMLLFGVDLSAFEIVQQASSSSEIVHEGLTAFGIASAFLVPRFNPFGSIPEK